MVGVHLNYPQQCYYLLVKQQGVVFRRNSRIRRFRASACRRDSTTTPISNIVQNTARFAKLGIERTCSVACIGQVPSTELMHCSHDVRQHSERVSASYRQHPRKDVDAAAPG